MTATGTYNANANPASPNHANGFPVVAARLAPNAAGASIAYAALATAVLTPAR